MKNLYSYRSARFVGSGFSILSSASRQSSIFSSIFFRMLARLILSVFSMSNSLLMLSKSGSCVNFFFSLLYFSFVSSIILLFAQKVFKMFLFFLMCCLRSLVARAADL